jgi:hypothetical protein
MTRDSCHELEITRASLAQVMARLANPLIGDPLRKTLELTAAGLRNEIEWWRPRCDRELEMENGDG